MKGKILMGSLTEITTRYMCVCFDHVCAGFKHIAINHSYVITAFIINSVIISCYQFQLPFTIQHYHYILSSFHIVYYQVYYQLFTPPWILLSIIIMHSYVITASIINSVIFVINFGYHFRFNIILFFNHVITSYITADIVFT